jgi:hypothetical protein
MLSESNKKKVAEARTTLKRSEALVLQYLDELGITYQEFQLIKNSTINQRVYLN